VLVLRVTSDVMQYAKKDYREIRSADVNQLRPQAWSSNVLQTQFQQLIFKDCNNVVADTLNRA